VYAPFGYTFVDQKEEGNWNDQGGDGRTNFTLKIKDQATRLTLHEHDDDEFIKRAFFLYFV
jgi:hypothetical protein